MIIVTVRCCAQDLSTSRPEVTHAEQYRADYTLVDLVSLLVSLREPLPDQVGTWTQRALDEGGTRSHDSGYLVAHSKPRMVLRTMVTYQGKQATFATEI
jgi:hypothetical protein